MVSKLLGILIATCVYCFFFLTPANAATIYVTPGQSIQSIVNTANSGDIIQVSSGSYPETIRINKNGLTIKCIQSRQCIVKKFEVWGSNNIIEGFKITGGEIAGLDVRQSNNTLEYIEIYDILYNSGDANGVILFGSGHVFDNIYIHNIDQYHMSPEPHQDCFQTWDVPLRGGVANHIAISNVICDMPQTGDDFISKVFQAEGGSHDWTINNIVGIAPMACLFIDEAYNINITHSTFIGGGIDQPQGCKFLKIYDTPAPHNNSMTYNIFQNITSGPVIYETDDAVQSSNNCFWQTTSRVSDPGDIYANPLLRSDWTVPSNSPCINMGAGSTQLISSPPSSPTPKLGDANNDNNVDGVDYIIWLNHYGQFVSAIANGDFNSDNKVDGVDYIIWLNNYEG